MKRKLLAFLLAALTLVGCMPFALFAANNGDASTLSTEGFTAPTREELINAVGAENIFADLTFDECVVANNSTTGNYIYQNSTTNGHNKNAPINFVLSTNNQDGNYSGINKGVYSGIYSTNSAGTIRLIDGAITYGPTSDGRANKQSYISVFIANEKGEENIADSPAELGPMMHKYRNSQFVISVDVQRHSDFFNKPILRMYSRFSGSSREISLVSMTADGGIYATHDSAKTVVGTVATDSFTNVAVRVDPVAWKYYVYIDGALTNANGVDLPAARKTDNVGKTYTPDGESTAYPCVAGDYYLNGVRTFMYEVNNDGIINEDILSFDNLRVYYTTEDIGLVGEVKSYSSERDKVIDMLGEKYIFADVGFDDCVTANNSTTGNWIYQNSTSNGHNKQAPINFALSTDSESINYTGINKGVYSGIYNTNSAGTIRLINGAIKYGPTSDGRADKESYISLYISNGSGSEGVADSPEELGPMMHEFKNSEFVISFDIQKHSSTISGCIMYMYSRFSTNAREIRLVEMNKDGGIYVLGYENLILGNVSTSEFTNITVRVDPVNWQYYVYVDGVLGCETPFALPESEKEFDVGKTYTIASGSSYTTAVGDYYLNGIRTYKYVVETMGVSNEDLMSYDNIMVYYTNQGYLGEIIPETENNLADFDMRLALYDDISAQFRLNKSNIETAIGCTINSIIYNKTAAVLENDGYYYLSTGRISPNKIAADLEITVNATKTDGTHIKAKTSISIADYCYKALAATSISTDEKNLIADTLNYAAAAETWVDGKTENLVNEGLSDYSQYGTKTEADISATGMTHTGTKNIASISIGLNNGLRLRITDPTDLKLVVKDNSGVIATITNFVPVNDELGGYYAYFGGSSAAQLKKLYTFELVNTSEQVVETITNYSFETYANTVIVDENNEYSDSHKALVKAMIIYGDSAYSYAVSLLNKEGIPL